MKRERQKRKTARLIAGLLAAVLLLTPLSSAFAETEAQSAIIGTAIQSVTIGDAADVKGAITGLTTAATQTATKGDYDYSLIRLTPDNTGETYTAQDLKDDPEKLEKIKTAQELLISRGEALTLDEGTEATVFLPALGSANNYSAIYPGNILQTKDGDTDRIITGEYANTVLKRYVGDFQGGTSDNVETSFSATKNIANLTPGQGADSAFRELLYSTGYDSEGRYIGLPTGNVTNDGLTVVQVTTPQQTAALAGVGAGALNRLISADKWTKINNGELTAAVISYYQIIGYIDCVIPDRSKMTLYDGSVSASDISDAFSGGGMMIDRVYYGRQMLALAELTAPGLGENLSGLAEAFKAHLNGEDISGNAAYQNELKYARVTAMEIGWNAKEAWQTIFRDGSAEDLKDLLADDYEDWDYYLDYNNQAFEQHLVPVRYQATALNGNFYNESPDAMERQVDPNACKVSLTRCIGCAQMDVERIGSISDWTSASLTVRPLDLDCFVDAGELRETEESIDIKAIDPSSYSRRVYIEAYKMFGSYTLKITSSQNHSEINGSGHNGAPVSVSSGKSGAGGSAKTRRHNLNGSNLHLSEYFPSSEARLCMSSIKIKNLYDEADILSQTGKPLEDAAYDGKASYVTWTENAEALQNADNLALYNTAPKEISRIKKLAGVTHTAYTNSEGNPEFRIDIPFKYFMHKVTVNDALLAPEDYTAWEGSTIIALNSDYVRTLKPGQYTMKAYFMVGGEEVVGPCNFTIESPAEMSVSANPYTGIPGDGGMKGILAAAVIAFGLAAAWMAGKRINN